MTKVREQCFCAFCKNERKVFRKKTQSLSGYVASGVLAWLLALVFWEGFDPRALVFFVSGVIITELVVHFRWRLGMSCPYCGFDPILYRKSPAMACSKVKLFMEGRKKDPMFYLSSNGYEKLAKIKRIEEIPSQQSKELGENTTKTESSPALSERESIEELLNMPPV